MRFQVTTVLAIYDPNVRGSRRNKFLAGMVPNLSKPPNYLRLATRLKHP